MKMLSSKGFIEALVKISIGVNIAMFLLFVVEIIDVAGSVADYQGTAYAVGYFVGVVAVYFALASIIHLLLLALRKYLTK